MPETWPANVPARIDVSTFQEVPGDGRLRANPDTGPAKVRLRSTAVPRQVSFALVPLTTAQKQTLKAFIETTLAGGTLSFTFPTACVAPGESDWQVRLVDIPPWGRAGKMHTTTLKLEILP
jgi:hypothetical protein